LFIRESNGPSQVSRRFALITQIGKKLAANQREKTRIIFWFLNSLLFAKFAAMFCKLLQIAISNWQIAKSNGTLLRAVLLLERRRIPRWAGKHEESASAMQAATEAFLSFPLLWRRNGDIDGRDLAES
jgi:hypothetical protein